MIEYDKDTKTIRNTERGSELALDRYAFEDRISYTYFTYSHESTLIKFGVMRDHGHIYAKALVEKEMGGDVRAGQLREFNERVSKVLSSETPLHENIFEISREYMPLPIVTAEDLMGLLLEFSLALFESRPWSTVGLVNADPKATEKSVAPFLLLDSKAGFAENLSGKWFDEYF
ncbi:hypothetical protein [uncultured Tateyamaria sp.]|uniref:hypothetical protein n=1 Tax=uncultured Tateyamaria sp. TaxID=455651 RepID=UPI0026091F83|nr:hypothetical protein [uncultured Tateyamaria sp.]